MKLAEYGESFAFDIAFGLAGIHDPHCALDQLGALSLDVSTKLRAMAVMVLLVKADSDRFHHNLIRSGIVRETYLRRCRDEGLLNDYHRSSGRSAPLIDAVAAGEWGLAQRIADLSPDSFQVGREYEDDFCQAQMFQRFVKAAPDEGEIRPFLDRFEAYVDGRPNARLSICSALTFRDQDAFDAAFDELLVTRQAEIDAENERSALEEPFRVALRYIFVEGLAILRLATRRGLRTQRQYPFCPSLARLPMQQPFPGE